jgi:branched-chain amino acid transport system permease protein
MQGIRDNPRRLTALGFWTGLHQVAAFGVAGFIAAVGGVLSLWYNGGISPGSIGVTAMVNILIIAVIGGLGHPKGAFIGALLFVLIQNFAIDLVSRERFNTLIGMTFLVIVLVSPDGLIGLWQRIRQKAVA